MKTKKTRQFGLVCVMVCGLLAASTAMATSYSFVGGSGNWNVVSNWNPSGVPGTTDNAYMNGPTNTPHITDTQEVSQVYIGVGTNNSRLYIDSSGDLTCSYMTLGESSSAFAYQYGNNTPYELYLGHNSGRYGEYRVYGGQLTINHRLGVGWSGPAQFLMNLSGGTGNGSISGAGDLYISEDDSTSKGTFQGYGTVGMTGDLYQNGKVIADGFGTAHDLDMSSFNSVSTSYGLGGDGSSDGWYAERQGRLLLPAVSVGAGSNTVKWGDSSTGSPKMKNSVQVGFTGASAGSLDISLLATDRTDVPGFSGDLIGVWDISGPSFSSAALTIRYDDALASSLGLTEDDLKLFHYTGGHWVNITGSIDTANNLISGSTDSLSMFAVGVPEPATIGLLTLGFGFLRRK